jgi:hypothetical protein
LKRSAAAIAQHLLAEKNWGSFLTRQETPLKKTRLQKCLLFDHILAAALQGNGAAVLLIRPAATRLYHTQLQATFGAGKNFTGFHLSTICHFFLHTYESFLRNIRLTPLREGLENTAEQPEKIAFYEIKAHPA